MSILDELDHPNQKTVDYFIDTKVDDLIERAVVEGKKRRQIETNVADVCADPKTDDGNEYLNSFGDFTGFPKYEGRGIQDTAPDFEGDTLTMWYSEVSQADVDDFVARVVNAGFVKKTHDDYVKEDGNKKYTMAISYGSGKLRVFYKIG